MLQYTQFPALSEKIESEHVFKEYIPDSPDSGGARGFAIPGYVAPLVVITAGYALFQAANNTAVLADIRADQRGVVSGILNLSRSLGLITGASVMGAVFAIASGATDIMTARAEAVATGMRTTIAVAAGLVVVALVIAIGSRALARRALARRASPTGDIS